MVKLRNGNNLTEVLKIFRTDKKPTHDKDGYSYFKIEEYTELLDTCFGADGYIPHYSEGKIEALPSGQCVIIVKAVIDILGENGNVVYSMEGYGTYEIVLAKSGDRYISLSTAGSNANANALKAACCNAGAFGKRNADGAGKSGSTGSSSSRQQASSSSSGTQAHEVVRKFFVKKPMEVFWTDGKGKPAYRFVGQEVVDGKMREKLSEVLFYPNQYKNVSAKLNELIGRILSTGEKGEVISFKVMPVSEQKRNKDYFASYTFKSFI